MEKAPAKTEDAKPAISRSERIFDWLVYGGIAGVGAFISTIPLAFWAKYGKGAERFKSAGKWLESKGMSAHSAESTIMTTALMQGGNLMILPVKLAEDFKVQGVTAISNAIGEEVDCTALEAEDKQTWSSIIKARVAAWLAVFSGFKIAGAALSPEKFTAFEENFSKAACQLVQQPTHVAGKETKAFRYGKIAALDLFATAAASALLYAGSRVFAHWERQEEERKEHKPVHTHAVPVAETASEASETPRKTEVQQLRKQPDESYGASVRRQSAQETSVHLSA